MEPGHDHPGSCGVGFQGIELRGLEDDLDVTSRSEFGGEAFRRRLQDQGLEIACFSSSVMLDPEAAAADASFDELKRYTQLCVTFGTPFIRIFGGGSARFTRIRPRRRPATC